MPLCHTPPFHIVILAVHVQYFFFFYLCWVSSSTILHKTTEVLSYVFTGYTSGPINDTHAAGRAKRREDAGDQQC